MANEKSSMLMWAEKEIEIAKKAAGEEEDEIDKYANRCYDCALELITLFSSQEHSGFSAGITRRIFDRLVEGKPLTPIEDTDDIWIKADLGYDGGVMYQCTRMYSLFKCVENDGSVRYTDNDYYTVKDINDDEHNTFHWGLAGKLVYEKFPITFPYNPPMKPYVITCNQFSSEGKEDKVDTVEFLDIYTPDGQQVSLHKYFKSEGGKWVSIPASEYTFRQIHAENKKKEG